MAISSPLAITGLIKTNKKLSSGSTETLKNVQDVLIKKTKIRREIFQRQTILQNRRSENERRKITEDELEASNLVIRPGGAAQLIQGSAKGFFERLIGFLGYLTAGWIMNNLPTWIAMGKEFIARAQRMGQLISGFVGNITNIFLGFGNLLGATYQNLIQFDLFDTSNRVKNAFGQLTGSVDEMGRELEESIKLLTTPLTEGIASGENAPGTGQQRTSEGAYEPGAPYSGSGGAGTKEQRAMLDAIAFAEGTRGEPNNGYKTLFGFGQFDDYSRHPDKVVRSGRYASAAAGRYQFMPDTFNRLANKLGLKDFSPASQDKAAIELAREYGVTQELLAKEGMSPKVSALLGRQWASFPGKSIGLDQPTKKLKDIQNTYQKSLGSSQQPTQSQTQSTPGTGQSFRPLPQGSFKGGESQKFGASRDNGRRKHLGVDITESNWKPGSDPRIPVVAIRGGVVSQRDYVGGSQYKSGLVIDQDDGYSIRYLHMSPSVRRGQKVSAGQRIGRLVDLGIQTHLHIELYSGSQILDPTDYIKTIEKGGVPRAIRRQQAPTPAQITPSATQQTQQSQQLSQQRTGPTVIISETPTPEPQIIQSSSGSSIISSLEIDEFTLLNNFMRNKLLLDLAYL